MLDFEAMIKLFAAVMLLFGAVECFAGFRIMKVMLAIYGFLAGTVIGVVLGVRSDSVALGLLFVVAAGTVLAALSYKLYQAGIFLMAMFLVSVAGFLVFDSLPPAMLTGFAAGILAVLFTKPVVVVTTAFSGARLMLSAAYMLMGLDTDADPVVTVVLWLVITAAGIACQYATTKGDAKTQRMPLNSTATVAVNPASFSEKKYPGMQRAYRNFCIRCGTEMGTASKCPKCGFRFDD